MPHQRTSSLSFVDAFIVYFQRAMFVVVASYLLLQTSEQDLADILVSSIPNEVSGGLYVWEVNHLVINTLRKLGV